MIATFQLIPITEAQIRASIIQALSVPGLSFEDQKFLMQKVLQEWAQGLEGFEIRATLEVKSIGFMANFNVTVRIIPLN